MIWCQFTCPAQRSFAHLQKSHPIPQTRTFHVSNPTVHWASFFSRLVCKVSMQHVCKAMQDTFIYEAFFQLKGHLCVTGRSHKENRTKDSHEKGLKHNIFPQTKLFSRTFFIHPLFNREATSRYRMYFSAASTAR